MTTLKKDQLIKNKHGQIFKVMEVLGQIFFISYSDKFDTCWFHQTEEQLKRDGYTWDTPAWEPSYRMRYWFCNTRGEVDWSGWDNDEVDNDRGNFLGIYQTQELCEAALLEIRRKLGK